MNLHPENNMARLLQESTVVPSTNSIKNDTTIRGMAGPSRAAFSSTQTSILAAPHSFLFLKAPREIQISLHEFDALKQTTKERILFVYDRTMCQNTSLDDVDSHSRICQALRFLGVGIFEYDKTRLTTAKDLLANWVYEWNKLLFDSYEEDLESLMEQAFRRRWGLDELKAITARWMQGKDENRLLEPGRKLMEIERLERERLGRERLEREIKAAANRREQAAYNERVRQNAKQHRKQLKREKLEKEKNQQDEWDELWKNYQTRFNDFKVKGPVTERELGGQIPWPVRSGLCGDVTASNVIEFFKKAIPKNQSMTKVMRKECQKWHPDMMARLLKGSMVTVMEQMMLDMVAREVTILLNTSNRKSAVFLG